MQETVRVAMFLLALVMALMCLAGNAFASAASDLESGKALMAQGDYNGAIQVFVRVTEPSLVPEATRMLGLCYQRMGKYPQAIAEYSKFLSAYADLKDACDETKCWLAEAYLLSKDYESGRQLFQAILTTHPEGAARWHLAIGISYQNEGKYSAAAASLMNASDAVEAKRDPNLPAIIAQDIKGRLAECCLMKGDYDTAVATYQAMAHEYTSFADRAKLMVGVCYQRKGDNERALSIFNDLQTNGTDPAVVKDAMLNSCDCLCQPGRIDEALAMLDKAYEEHSEWRADILFEKGQILADYKRDYASALDTYKKLIADYADWSRLQEVQRRVGLAFIDLGQLADAKVHFGKLASTDPNNPQWALCLAYCSYREENWAAARDGLLAASNNFSSGEWFAQAEYLYGECCTRLGDKATATAAFQDATNEYAGNSWANEAKMRLDQLQTPSNGTGTPPSNSEATLLFGKHRTRVAGGIDAPRKDADLPMPQPMAVAANDQPKREVN